MIVYNPPFETRLYDLGWYLAHKADNPSIRGAIPINHFHIVCMSDDGRYEQLNNDTKSLLFNIYRR